MKNLASFDGIKTVLTRVVLALWKEYSFSDTRYADSNPLVLSLESYVACYRDPSKAIEISRS